MAKRLSLGRLEKMVEDLNRDVDLEGSDVTVNTLTSDGKITTNDGGLAVIGDDLTLTNSALTIATGSVTYRTMPPLGGRVTQLTSKATAVPGGDTAGSIVTHSGSLAGGATVTFTVGTDSDDEPILTDFSEGGSIVLLSCSRTTTDRAFGNDYTVSTGAIDGSRAINPGYASFQINITNNTGGPLSEALVINYIIMNVAIGAGGWG